ncbi:hypothetical protein DPMN_045716, partial [Dreissena polymorpha]
MDTRFSYLQTKAAMGYTFIPDQMCSSPVSASDLEWFNDDLPSPQSLPAELHFIWQARWKGVPNPPTSLQGSDAHCDSQLYPTIYTMLYWHEAALLYIINYLVTVGGVDPSKEACLASDNTYRGTACGCVVFQSYGLSHGHFYSPNYPNFYQSNFDCILYTFIGDVNEIVEIKFLNMDLEQQRTARGHECKDYIRIYSNTDRGEVNEDSRYDEEICGSLASMEEKKFYSSGRALVLEFHIGANSSEKRHTGFKGVFSFLEKSAFKTDGLLQYGTQCSYNIQSMNNHTKGNFYSPRYPQKYPRSSHCQYMFMGQETETVKVTFNLIRLPKPNHCGDYIRVYDGSNSSGKLLKQFCDHTFNNEVVLSTSPYLYIEFKSDDDKEKEGFSAEYTFLDNRWEENNPSPTSNDGSSERVTGPII